MGVKRSLIEVVHDEGYGDDLLWHINTTNSRVGQSQRWLNALAATVAVNGHKSGDNNESLR